MQITLALYRFDGRNLMEVDAPDYERLPYHEGSELRFKPNSAWGAVTHVGYFEDGILRRVELIAPDTSPRPSTWS
jgi:hypothetical protein